VPAGWRSCSLVFLTNLQRQPERRRIQDRRSPTSVCTYGVEVTWFGLMQQPAVRVPVASAPPSGVRARWCTPDRKPSASEVRTLASR
jgi:hypothetical protein